MIFRAFYPVFQPPLTQCPMSLRADGAGNLIQDGPHPSFILCISGSPESLHHCHDCKEAEGCFCLWVYTRYSEGSLLLSHIYSVLFPASPKSSH